MMVWPLGDSCMLGMLCMLGSAMYLIWGVGWGVGWR
jgi:hypothetical protein